MTRAERIWRVQRVSGILAMIMLSLAMLALFDGLKGGLFGNQQGVHLIPGEEYAISGPMPPRTERLEEFVIAGNAHGSSIALIPDGIFSGYWFGAGMWRGRIVVGERCLAGMYEFSVRDKYGEKQNPALVYQVQVFADAQDRQAHSPSLIMRETGGNPYIYAACLGLLGLLFGGWNYWSGHLWSAVLAEHGCGEVFRFKRVNGHLEVDVELFSGVTLHEGTILRFSHPVRGDSCHGTVISCSKDMVTVRLETNSSVLPGDVACRLQDDTVEVS